MRGSLQAFFDEDVSKLNMTPMIDIVFQLLIFFLLTNELTALNAEKVVLTPADHLILEKEQNATDRVVTVNVVLDSNSTDNRGAVVIAGKHFVTPEGGMDLQSLKDYLILEREKYNVEEPNPSDPSVKLTALQVLVRADQNVRSEYLHHIYEACRTAGIYKVNVAAVRRSELTSGGGEAGE
ncbi:MAG: biopolymer transporter ExbD [Planctomycetes bacterium]|nr:biopolymer transporter ExbD [Planctomycetota bacterium]